MNKATAPVDGFNQTSRPIIGYVNRQTQDLFFQDVFSQQFRSQDKFRSTDFTESYRTRTDQAARSDAQKSSRDDRDSSDDKIASDKQNTAPEQTRPEPTSDDRSDRQTDTRRDAVSKDTDTGAPATDRTAVDTSTEQNNVVVVEQVVAAPQTGPTDPAVSELTAAAATQSARTTAPAEDAPVQTAQTKPADQAAQLRIATVDPNEQAAANTAQRDENQKPALAEQAKVQATQTAQANASLNTAVQDEAVVDQDNQDAVKVTEARKDAPVTAKADKTDAEKPQPIEAADKSAARKPVTPAANTLQPADRTTQTLQAVVEVDAVDPEPALTRQDAGPARADLTQSARPDTFRIDTLGRADAAEVTKTADAQLAQSNATRENVERVVKAAQAAINRGSSRIQIRLDPPDLGHMRITMKQSAGGLEVQLQASNPRALQMIEQSRGELRLALESQGINTTQIDVQLRNDLRQDQSSSQQQAQQQQQQQLQDRPDGQPGQSFEQRQSSEQRHTEHNWNPETETFNASDETDLAAGSAATDTTDRLTTVDFHA